MDSTRLTHLPADLTSLISLYLPWRDLYTIYISLPELRIYDDPHHNLWRKLYHRDLSSYPLPAGTPYREQYFWGHNLVDTPLDVARLVELGYDKVLERLDVDLITKYRDLAAKRGYLSIVRLMNDDQPHTSALWQAVRNDQIDVVEFLLHPALTEAELITAAVDAAAEGDADIMHLILNRALLDPAAWALPKILNQIPNRDIQNKLLNAALYSDNPDLVAELMPEVPDITELLNRIDKRGGRLSVVIYLLEYLSIEDQPQYYPLLMRLAVGDCRLDYIKALYDLGVKIDDTYIVECKDPETHEWLAAHMDAEHIAELLTLIARKLPLAITQLYYPAANTHDLDLELLTALLQSEHNPNMKHLVLELAQHLSQDEILTAIYDTNQDTIDVSLLTLLLDRLDHEHQLTALNRGDVQTFSHLLTHHHYTPQEYATMLADLYRNESRDIEYKSAASSVIRLIPTSVKAEVVDVLRAMPTSSSREKKYMTRIISQLR